MSTGVNGMRASSAVDDAPAVSVEEGLGSLLAIERARLESETRRVPWWKNVTTLIAVLAFVLSGFSTWETVRYNNAQNQTTDRQQLVTLVDQLAQEPQSRAQIWAAYKTQPTLRDNLLSALGTAKAVQAEEAGQIIDSLHGSVSSSAARQVSASFLDLGSLKPALHYALIARARAPDPDLRAAALRETATIRFESDAFAAAEADYRAAYHALSVPAGYTPYNIAENQLYTDTYVFSLELSARRCAQALALYNDAVRKSPAVASNLSTYQSDQTREAGDYVALGHTCPAQTHSALAPPPVQPATS